MGYWRFKSYKSDDGNQPWEWLNGQSEAVRYHIWAHIVATSLIEGAPVEEFSDLPERYGGLSQLIIPFGEGTSQVALIGFWEPDSINFIVAHCTEIEQTSYQAALERALECKRYWEEELGDVYELFDDDAL